MSPAYSDVERRLLARYFSEVDPKPHADVFLVRNLPPEVAATLNGVYSRSPLSMRDNFLERLKRGLAATGRTLEETFARSGDPPADLLTEVMADRSGQFLKTYAIDHGHNSLREGSVVHLAVERVSQLVTRFVQRERRCSFEESSTRYISFGAEDHWRDPDVFAAGGPAAAAYAAILDETFTLYGELGAHLLEHLKAHRPLAEGEKEGPWLRALRAEAFDAARYLLTPAVHTKWGMVADARTLSDIVTELVSHPLAEFRIVGERIREQAEKSLTTLLAHARENRFLQHLHAVLPELAAELAGNDAPAAPNGGPRTELLAHDPELDVRLLASLLYESSREPFTALCTRIANLSPEARESLMERALRERGPRDALPFGLEGATPFEFEVLLDFGAYRDVGRHRKGFQQQQNLTVENGYVVPPLIEEAGLGARVREVLDKVAERHAEVAAGFPLAAGYVTPFAFLQRVRIVFDPRQVAYFVELRSGPEGHFAYRQVAIEMFRHVERVSPLFARFVRARLGNAFLGRMESEQTADERRLQRMRRAGEQAAE